MDEQKQRADAAVAELNAIGQMLTQRCVNHAADNALLKAALVNQAAEHKQNFEALKNEVEALKAMSKKKKSKSTIQQETKTGLA